MLHHARMTAKYCKVSSMDIRILIDCAIFCHTTSAALQCEAPSVHSLRRCLVVSMAWKWRIHWPVIDGRCQHFFRSHGVEGEESAETFHQVIEELDNKFSGSYGRQMSKVHHEPVLCPPNHPNQLSRTAMIDMRQGLLVSRFWLRSTSSYIFLPVWFSGLDRTIFLGIHWPSSCKPRGSLSSKEWMPSSCKCCRKHSPMRRTCYGQWW